jgi:molybdopterin/thiamine biosynthesis adenylyltransferase
MSTIEEHSLRLTAENAAAILSGYDIVVDGSDNFETRYLVADTAEELGLPLVAGALGRFDGSLTVLMPHETDESGAPYPRYRDLFPEPPPEGAVPTCAEAGILGAVAGVIGTLQAVEVLKLITGTGEPLVGRLLLYDALSVRFQTMNYGRRKRKPSGAKT